MGINSKGTLQYPHTLSSPFAFQLELNIMGNWPILIFLVSWKIMKLQLTHVLNKTHEVVSMEFKEYLEDSRRCHPQQNLEQSTQQT